VFFYSLRLGLLVGSSFSVCFGLRGSRFRCLFPFGFRVLGLFPVVCDLKEMLALSQKSKVMIVHTSSESSSSSNFRRIATGGGGGESDSSEELSSSSSSSAENQKRHFYLHLAPHC
jgi:hypothetical protein